MNNFDPGEGWREAGTDPAQVMDKVHVRFYDPYNDVSTYWVREETVPPLPSEPYTVIRVAWISREVIDNNVLTLIPDQEYAWNSYDDGWHASNLQKQISGFEVLSEPRAVIAEAIFSRVREYNGLTAGESDEFDSIEREFGVKP